jgi:hypothetical protein
MSFDGGIYDGAPPHGTPSAALQNADEDNEEVSRKKKVCYDDNKASHLISFPCVKAKRTYVGEQYVCITCGRTDSPEWRKVQTYLFFCS